ncbi:MAG TPA: carboxypeptidase-like regulatory domain-containing protein [Bryobacteraceae bacterium]
MIGLIPLLLVLAPTAPDTYIVTGTIVDHLQNRPLHTILVTLTSTQDRRLTVSEITGADGRFGFNNVPAGKYTLSAQRRGNSRPQLYREDGGYSTAIAVGPGLPSQNIVFPLEAPGSISGTVLDQNGDPPATAHVWLYRKTVSGGKPEIQIAGQRQVDRSGSFHAGHLGPGTYFVAVSGRPWYARSFPQGPVTLSGGLPMAAPPNSEFDVVYPVTYYGDTTDPAAAAPINLAEGGSATIQINLRAVPAVHVDLGPELQDGRSHNLMRNTFLAVETVGGNTMPVFANMMGMGINGRQELGVAPGHYILHTTAFDNSSGAMRGTMGPGARIDIAGNTSITPGDLKPTSLSGQLRFEGSEVPRGQTFLLFSCGNRPFSVRVLKDGSLQPDGQAIRPGHCEVTLGNAPGFYLKTIAAGVGDAKASADTVELAEGVDNRITAVAAKGAMSELNGFTVQNEQPLSSAMVLLLPEDPARASLIRRDQSDSDGSFLLRDILPGRYTLLAIDNGKDLAYRDPAVIQPYLAQGVTLELPRTDKTPVRVNVAARRE